MSLICQQEIQTTKYGICNILCFILNVALSLVTQNYLYLLQPGQTC